MGAAMAVILANLWLKQFESTIASDSKTSSIEMKPFCGKCQKIVTKRLLDTVHDVPFLVPPGMLPFQRARDQKHV